MTIDFTKYPWKQCRLMCGSEVANAIDPDNELLPELGEALFDCIMAWRIGALRSEDLVTDFRILQTRPYFMSLDYQEWEKAIILVTITITRYHSQMMSCPQHRQQAGPSQIPTTWLSADSIPSVEV